MLLHRNAEDEEATLAQSLRFDRDSTSSDLDNLLYDSQSETYTLVIEVCSALQFAELAKKLREIFLVYTSASVFYVDDKLA